MKLKGFTLLELVVALSLFAFLLFLGLTASRDLLSNNEQHILVDDIKNAVYYAKNQSLILGKTVYLKSLDKERDWSRGMMLGLIDNNQWIILHQWQWEHKFWSVSWAGLDGDKKIRLSYQLMHAISNGTFSLMNHQTKEKVKLVLNRLGRIKVIWP